MWEAERFGPDEAFEMMSEIIAVDGDTGVARVTVLYEEAEQKERRLHRQQKEYRDLWVVRLDEAGSASTSRSGPSGRRIRMGPRGRWMTRGTWVCG